MSKLIDADKLKESLAEKFVIMRESLMPCDWEQWHKNALLAMDTVDGQEEVLLSCPKCHGKGTYNLPKIDRRDWDIADEWEQPRKCLVCKGTGKITIDEYEDYQERCRWKK